MVFWPSLNIAEGHSGLVLSPTAIAPLPCNNVFCVFLSQEAGIFFTKSLPQHDCHALNDLEKKKPLWYVFLQHCRSRTTGS